MDVYNLVEALKYNQSLKILHLSDIGFSDLSIKRIAELLEVNQFLDELYLEGNDMDNLCAGWIANALKVNKSLTGLNMLRTTQKIKTVYNG